MKKKFTPLGPPVPHDIKVKENQRRIREHNKAIEGTLDSLRSDRNKTRKESA